MQYLACFVLCVLLPCATPQQYAYTRGVVSDCFECRFSADNRFYRTDGVSAVTASVRCDDGVGQAAMCERPEEQIRSFVPQAEMMCDTPKLVCYDPPHVTSWGDARMAPNFETISVAGIANPELRRDFWPEDYDLLARRASYIPKHDRRRLGGAPDVYAYSGGSVLQSMLGILAARIPQVGTLDSRPVGTNYNSVPPYENPNTKLFIYSDGNPLGFVWNDYLTGLCGRRCVYNQMYNYLANHRGVTFEFMQGAKLRTNIIPLGYSAAQRQTLLNAFIAEFGCTDDEDCFTSLPSVMTALGQTPPANRAFLSCRAQAFRASYGHECTVARTNGRDMNLPTIAGGNQMLRMETYFYSDGGEQLTYPFGLMQTWTIAIPNNLGRTFWFEQSEDGSNWFPFAVTMSNQTFTALTYGGTLLQALQGANSDQASYPCRTAAAGDPCYMPIGVTGNSRYLRMVTLVPHGSNTRSNFMGARANTARTLFTPYMWAAKRQGPVQLYVTPSLVAPTNQSGDFDECNKVPGCTFIPSTYGVTYPGDGATANEGSITVRNFMRRRVMTELFGCEFRKDPVKEFLETTNNGTSVDRCDRTSLDMETCYSYSTAPTTGNRVTRTDFSVRNENRVYQKNGGVLTVTTRQFGGIDVVRPALAIGQITPENPDPLYYVYTVPNSNAAFRFRGLYINASAICMADPSAQQSDGNPSADNLPFAPNCTCSDVTVGPFCLCADAIAYGPSLGTPQPAVPENPPDDPSFLVDALRVHNPVFKFLYTRVATRAQGDQINCERVACDGQPRCRDRAAELVECEALKLLITRYSVRLEVLRRQIAGHFSNAMNGTYDIGPRTQLSPLVDSQMITRSPRWPTSRCGFVAGDTNAVRRGGAIRLFQPTEYAHLNLTIAVDLAPTADQNLDAVHDAENLAGESSVFCLTMSSMRSFTRTMALTVTTHREFLDMLRDEVSLGATGLAADWNGVLSAARVEFSPVKSRYNVSNVACISGERRLAQDGYTLVFLDGEWQVTRAGLLSEQGFRRSQLLNLTTVVGLCGPNVTISVTDADHVDILVERTQRVNLTLDVDNGALDVNAAASDSSVRLDYNVTGDVTHTGRVVGSLREMLSVGGDSSHNVTVGGDLSGTFVVTQDASTVLRVGGSYNHSSAVTGTSTVSVNASGQVTIDIDGDRDVHAEMRAGRDFFGNVTTERDTSLIADVQGNLTETVRVVGSSVIHHGTAGDGRLLLNVSGHLVSEISAEGNVDLTQTVAGNLTEVTTVNGSARIATVVTGDLDVSVMGDLTMNVTTQGSANISTVVSGDLTSLATVLGDSTLRLSSRNLTANLTGNAVEAIINGDDLWVTAEARGSYNTNVTASTSVVSIANSSSVDVSAGSSTNVSVESSTDVNLRTWSGRDTLINTNATGGSMVTLSSTGDVSATLSAGSNLTLVGEGMTALVNVSGRTLATVTANSPTVLISADSSDLVDIEVDARTVTAEINSTGSATLNVSTTSLWVDSDGDLTMDALIRGDARIEQTVMGDLTMTNRVNGSANITKIINGEVTLSLTGNLSLTAAVGGDAVINHTVAGDLTSSSVVRGNVSVTQSIGGDLTMNNTVNGSAVIHKTVNEQVEINIRGDLRLNTTVTGNAVFSHNVTGDVTSTYSSTGSASVSTSSDGPTTVETAATNVSLRLMADSLTAVANVSGDASLSVAGRNVTTTMGNGSRLIVSGDAFLELPLGGAIEAKVQGNLSSSVTVSNGSYSGTVSAKDVSLSTSSDASVRVAANETVLCVESVTVSANVTAGSYSASVAATVGADLLVRGREVNATVDASGDVSLSANVSRDMTLAATVGRDVSADFTIGRDLNLTNNVNGSATVIKRVVGGVTLGITGDLNLTAEVMGNASFVTTVAGDFGASLDVGRDVRISAEVGRDLRSAATANGTAHLTGSAETVLVNASGVSLSVEASVVGDANITSTVAGDLTNINNVNGSAELIKQVRGDINVTVLDGDVSINATVVNGTLDLDASVDGSLRSSLRAEGRADLSLGVNGTLRSTAEVSGAFDFSSNTTGNSTMTVGDGASVSVAGTANIDVNGTLRLDVNGTATSTHTGGSSLTNVMGALEQHHLSSANVTTIVTGQSTQHHNGSEVVRTIVNGPASLTARRARSAENQIAPMVELRIEATDVTNTFQGASTVNATAENWNSNHSGNSEITLRANSSVVNVTGEGRVDVSDTDISTVNIQGPTNVNATGDQINVNINGTFSLTRNRRETPLEPITTTHRPSDTTGTAHTRTASTVTTTGTAHTEPASTVTTTGTPNTDTRTTHRPGHPTTTTTQPPQRPAPTEPPAPPPPQPPVPPQGPTTVEAFGTRVDVGVFITVVSVLFPLAIVVSLIMSIFSLYMTMCSSVKYQIV